MLSIYYSYKFFNILKFVDKISNIENEKREYILYVLISKTNGGCSIVVSKLICKSWKRWFVMVLFLPILG